MALQQQFFTAKEAAQQIGVSDARIRQICIEHPEIGTKHGHAWLLSDRDIEAIRNLPDLRKKTA